MWSEDVRKQILLEDSRNTLLNKSKSDSIKSKQRYNRRTKSKVANTVKQYNDIDKNKRFKLDIITININVVGETDNYIVKISFGGFLDELHEQLKGDRKLDLGCILRALISAFNKDDVYIHCSCPDAKFRFDYWQTRTKINSGDLQNIPSNITNPNNKLGSGCKHALLVLSNTVWLVKVSSVINNYIKYMELHYPKMYADIIYPAIYEKEYEEPVQLTFGDEEDELVGDKETIGIANEIGRTRGQFKQGNTQGIRFASKPKSIQQSFEDEEEEI